MKDHDVAVIDRIGTNADSSSRTSTTSYAMAQPPVKPITHLGHIGVSMPEFAPPTKHQLALMIWLAVFPTLTVLNLVLGDWLKTLPPIPRTFVLATIAVPIVIYGLMPQLHRLRKQVLALGYRRQGR
jgi:hypothetical protein